MADLARVLRQLRRREARAHGGPELTYRELAAKTGWSRTMIGEYLTGKALPPTCRLDTLAQLLGATPAEQRALATARDRLEDARLAGGAGNAGPVPRVPEQVRAVPQQLPPQVTGFVGRTGQLAELDRLAVAAGERPAMVVAVVSGMGGVGKTTLAVRWAHQVADRFPDGQLYLDLRGYGPEEPLPAAEALAALLRSLGVDGASLPPGLPERAARLRTLLAGRRVLLVLDNAAGVAQVRPLLPGSPSCLVLVTSRDNLPGLVVRDGAHRIELDVLTPTEAGSLLHELLGDRATADPSAAAGLAQRCGRLPLALRVAAEQAAARPADSLAELAECLGSEQRRLAALDTGDDPHSQVRTVFSWSYRLLPPDRARTFRLLGLHPGRDLDEYAVAALCEVGPGPAGQLLAGLRQAHLVQPAGGSRYQLHDLLRAYAHERAAEDVGPPQARAARSRLFDYYRYAAAAAVRASFASEQSGVDPLAQDTAEPPALAMPPLARVGAGAGAAREWLDAERANLVATCEYAAGHGWPEHSVALSITLMPYLDCGYYQEALVVHQTAAAALIHTGQLHGPRAATVLTNLGTTFWRLGRAADALPHLEAAIRQHRAAGYCSGTGRAYAAIGVVYHSLGRFAESQECCEQGLALGRAAGDRKTEAGMLINLGSVRLRLERYQEAAEHYQQAARVATAAGHRYVAALAEQGLGAASCGLGRSAEALPRYQQALATIHEFGDRRYDGLILDRIGLAYQRLGRFAEAVDHLERALAFGVEFGDRTVQTRVLNTLGETLTASGRFDSARDRHAEALALARQIGDRLQQARALDGLGDADQATGDYAAASAHWWHAHAGYTEVAVPAAGRVQAKLRWSAGKPG